MVDILDFKLHHKYYISLLPPFRNEELKMCVKINSIRPRSNSNLVDYITFTTLSSSKDFLEECGLNSVSVPLPCIKKVESLHNILDKVLLDDMIYLINEYI